jgi:ADP-ribose pyrophosphatase YjhB (NUDIX family)
LPGGFLEEAEMPLDGLQRELLEETGIVVEPVEWFGATVDRYGEEFVLSLTWIVRGEGDPVASDDIEELQWFAPDAIPTEMAFESQGEVLRRWAERETIPG